MRKIPTEFQHPLRRSVNTFATSLETKRLEGIESNEKKNGGFEKNCIRRYEANICRELNVQLKLYPLTELDWQIGTLVTQLAKRKPLLSQEHFHSCLRHISAR